ncbi:hypothetical protein MJN54_32725, partial [Salmonella enterica subsp. enterica serovar Kentucky]|nr:hypothetical protein [Salmonella enterica subsp. enterica serovar Kentucky]
NNAKTPLSGTAADPQIRIRHILVYTSKHKNRINKNDTILLYCRYRAISENMTPGRIHSEVWFTLVYP